MFKKCMCINFFLVYFSVFLRHLNEELSELEPLCVKKQHFSFVLLLTLIVFQGHLDLSGMVGVILIGTEADL